MMEYYDMVLVLIPMSIVGFSGALHGIGVSLVAAVPLGALIATGILGHAMFVNAPGTRTASTGIAAGRTAD